MARGSIEGDLGGLGGHIEKCHVVTSLQNSTISTPNTNGKVFNVFNWQGFMLGTQLNCAKLIHKNYCHKHHSIDENCSM